MNTLRRGGNTRLETAVTGSQDGRRYEVAARFQRASDGGILPPLHCLSTFALLKGIAELPENRLCSATILITEWNIQSRGHGCEACAKTFADKESYHTMLFEERAELRRSDICADCWDKQFHEARDRKGFISHWQGVYHQPPAQTPDAIQKENAETLLRKLIELNDPKHIPAAYILAVMLERKRILKIKDQFTRAGLRVFIYEQPKTGDIFTIADPNLQLNQLEQVQRDVASLLEHGLNPPVPQLETALEATEPAEVGIETKAEPANG